MPIGRAKEDKKMASKKDCKYYKACGSSTNCERCKGYEKEKKKNRKGKGENNDKRKY